MAKIEKKRPKRGEKPEPAQQGITKLIVNNFKSLAAPEPYEIEVRPLTILAGANSSGKSSAVQPLLLLKQTLEASFDPGPLLLDGPHVKFSATAQILPKAVTVSKHKAMTLGTEIDSALSFQSTFRFKSNEELELEKTRYEDKAGQYAEFEIHEDGGRLSATIPPSLVTKISEIELKLSEKFQRNVIRRRCFFELRIASSNDKSDTGYEYDFKMGDISDNCERAILATIHLPALRGNPARSYRTTAVGQSFPGTFESYVASVIRHWQQHDKNELRQLWSNLVHLGLTWKVEAKQLDAVSVEIQVGRLPHARKGGSQDLVNIADVGFGVSQTLPVLVALLVAKPGQLVYIEQPEIHLHPKAQVALAEILANAAKRGVRVIIETHSALLLLAIQALVAEGKLDPNLAVLHWFQRNKAGISEIKSTELDEQGAYGDWPEDFGEVELDAQRRYLDAAEERLLRAARG